MFTSLFTNCLFSCLVKKINTIIKAEIINYLEKFPKKIETEKNPKTIQKNFFEKLNKKV